MDNQMDNANRVFAIVLFEGVAGSDGNISKKEIASISVSVDFHGVDERGTERIISAVLAELANRKEVADFIVDPRAAVPVPGYSAAPDAPAAPAAPADEQPDPFNGRGHGLMAPRDEELHERAARFGAERRRQSGYNDAERGLKPSQNDVAYMMGFNKYREQNP
jgi:hypothetical protein